MPRAFLIKSRSTCPATKKENIEGENTLHENAQPAEVTSNFTQDSTSASYVTSTSSPAQISSPNEVLKKSYPLNSPAEHVRSEIEDRKPCQTATDFARYSNHNITEVSRERKRSNPSYQRDEYEQQQTVKKVRKSQSKKSGVHYYKGENSNEQNDAQMQRKGEARFGNYTVERRQYANEHTRYHRHELASQSHDKSSGKMYSEPHGKQTRTFAYQNNGESLKQGKHLPTQRHSENKDPTDENTGLENVMIVEYHSVRARRPSYREDSTSARPNVTLHSSQRYSYSPPQSSPVGPPVVTSNYVPASPVTTSTAPLQQAKAPRVSAQPMPTQDNAKSPEQEPKVVYVPVYPVSQGPNGVIYEPIPNATPIMAKDTLPVQKARQPLEQPQIIQTVHPQRQEVVMTSPQPQVEQKPRVEYRPYEPQIPQQLTAAPAPQTYQQHPQGHVIIQQPQSAPATPTSYAVAQGPQYAVRPAPPPPPPPTHQYQQQQPQQSPPQPQMYQPHQPPASGPQPVIYRPVVSQSYNEPPRHFYPRPPAMPGYQERVLVQPVHGPPHPPVTIQQPMYHQQERPSHTQQPTRPPPLPSQPQHAEKPALPSPSYPQESASRLMTPRYTPDGPKQEHKFVYAPPPADFKNSPVYRVPPNDENTPIYHHDKAEHDHYKTGSRKRKPSYPSHAVLQSKTEGNLPSPANSNSRTPSPKETDLRCNERLVKSPHQPHSLTKSSLVMTPPVSPNDRTEKPDTVTVIVRDQGIQASPRGERTLEHTCFRKTSSHSRSNSYQSDNSEDDYLDDDSDKRSDSEERHSYENSPDSDMYTEDGTLVVHIPHPDDNNNDIHPKKHRGKKSNFRFLCKFCKKGFQWHSHLESHERTHTGEKPFKCPECDRAFCRADGLQCHMLVHNKKRPYKCPHCGKGFTDKIVLEKHIYSHTGVKPFKCEYCGRAFSDSLSIEKHLLVHTGTKPYKCPYCVRSFNDSQMLVRHIRSHTGEKPFKCKHCPMAFSKQSALIIHTRVHTGEKPYKCPHCVKSFSISGNLQRHILIHTGERPYKCSKCPKAFNNPSHLSRHISKLHAPQNGTSMKQPAKQYEPYARDQTVM